MDSHIQIPKVAFKEFVNREHYFFKYDISENAITKAFPKSTFTEKDYYSPEMEIALSKCIETPLKKLLLRARALPSDPQVFSIDTELIDLGWAYVWSLLARNPTLHNSFSDHLYYAQFCMSSQQQHDHIVEVGIKAASNWINETNFDFSFVINHTSTQFVLPTRGICECSIRGMLCFIIPLNPYCAILLKNQGQLIHSSIPNNTVLEILPGDNDSIAFFNKNAFQRQLKDGSGYVVCSDKDTIRDSLMHLNITPKYF